MRTQGPHFIVPPAAIDESTATITGDEAHHLTTVLRTGAGDPVSVSDGEGRIFQGRVAELGRDVRVGLVDAAEIPRSQPLVRVVHALPKGRKFDDIVRQLTELGVDEVAPVTTARTEPDPRGEGAERALARWRSVVHAAAKQSRRAWLPEVAPVVPWADAFPPEGAGVVCWEDATRSVRDVLDEATTVPRLSIGIGPEGGLTADEVAATGLPAAGLGSATVLRTETAGVVAATVLLTLLGRLG